MLYDIYTIKIDAQKDSGGEHVHLQYVPVPLFLFNAFNYMSQEKALGNELIQLKSPADLGRCKTSFLVYECYLPIKKSVMIEYSFLKNVFGSVIGITENKYKNFGSHAILKRFIIVISWMVNPYIHSSVYAFLSGYISPVPSLSFLPKQCWGDALLLFELEIAISC
jgi:hypothetical protein